jgi:hypothetical protein
MKRDKDQDVEKFLKRLFPSPPAGEMEAARERGLKRLYAEMPEEIAEFEVRWGLRKGEPSKESLINVNQPHERQYRTRKFGVSAQKLRNAVKRVGVSAAAVARELRKK